jgi:hypothetical protein
MPATVQLVTERLESQMIPTMTVLHISHMPSAAVHPGSLWEGCEWHARPSWFDCNKRVNILAIKLKQTLDSILKASLRACNIFLESILQDAKSYYRQTSCITMS